jgi:hypothetical protein
MKRTLITTLAIALSTTQALAGGYVEPRVEPRVAPEVIVEDTSSSSAGIIVPLLLLVLIGAAIANRGSETATISDARAKTDIVRVGATAEGLPLYQFRYIGDARVWEGVMAQDVLAYRPDAVLTGPGGVMLVDYAALGIEMRQVR